jgi:Fur family transcriptional regulator, zinc uptake regulator
MSTCSENIKSTKKSLLEAELLCKKNNLRFTSIRKRVFEIILEKHNPIKAYEILSLLQKEDSSAKPPTVYRALDFLLNSGLVHKLHSSNSFSACSHPNEKYSQCYFLICDICNNIKECCNSDIVDGEIKKIAISENFNINNISIEINGICDECI